MLELEKICEMFSSVLRETEKLPDYTDYMTYIKYIGGSLFASLYIFAAYLLYRRREKK